MNWESLLDEEAITALLPVEYAHFGKPVCEGLTVFLEGLPSTRQASILSSQTSLSLSADISSRLGLLALSCPVLQKVGQVLARDQRLPLVLRRHLQQLESLPPSVPLETITQILDKELGSLGHLGVTLAPPAIAEASVAVVIPFTTQNYGQLQAGVFKILKPGIDEVLEMELDLLERVGTHLDQRCEELNLPHLDYQEAFQQVRDKLSEETCLAHEQQRIAEARKFYANENQVQIPELYDFCTSRVTAMERIWGEKVTDHDYTEPHDRSRLSKLIVDAMIAKPVFSRQKRALFHSDPHAGNLFLTSDGRLGILDWSLVGWLHESDRASIVQLLLGAIMQDERRLTGEMHRLAAHGQIEDLKLLAVVRRWLQKLRFGQFPGLFWLTGMLDEAVRDAGLRLKADLMMFRKAVYTLEGVVAEVGAGTAVFDNVVALEFLKHLLKEWPSRWAAMPNSREFATRLSNLDLARATCSLPSAISRFWFGLGSDWCDAVRTNAKVLY